MFTTLISWLRLHVRSEKGQDLIEYAMLGGLIALAIIASVLFLQGAIADMGTGIGNCIDFDSATSCAPF
jgi:Flp pilus assembly pilin Flp